VEWNRALGGELIKMQEEKNQEREALARELKEQLNWYTLYASDEEYDERAVESILYLLDRLEPFDEKEMPQSDEAWERFQELVKQRKGIDSGAWLSKQELLSAKRKRMGNSRTAYFKYIVASVLLLVVLGMIGTTQVGAIRNSGFFHWLKWDETGTQMMTSPENLDGKTNVKEIHNHSDYEKIPEWAEEWLQIDSRILMPENYSWQYFEIEEGNNFYKIASHYLEEKIEKEMLLGMVMYRDKISFNTEEFVDYTHVGAYEAEQKQMNIYSKTETTGEIFYIICFYEGNSQYFMQGQDNLEELKGLIEQYWLYVKNNLEKNNFICNKMSFHAIYK